MHHRPKYLIISILALVVVSVGVVFFMMRNLDVKQDLPVINKSSFASSRQASSTSKKDNIREIIASVFTKEELADPEVKKVLDMFESPEFKSFLDTEPNGLGDYLDFFKSQGIALDKEELFAEFDTFFKEQFPTTTPDALEPQMRQKLSAIFVDADIKVETKEGIEQVSEILDAFFKDERNGAWMITQFKGDIDAYSEWVVDVFQNPTLELPDPSGMVEVKKPTESAAPTTVKQSPNIDKRQQVDSLFSEPPERLNEVIVGDGLPLLPSELTPEQEIENLFSERFPSEQFAEERFNRGMQYLTFFGEKNGLERLRVRDPDMAVYLERFIKQHKKRGLSR